jgi:hypothetical protein
MASYTVNFEDGTSHVYDNVPDDIDQQNVQDRASMEFSDKQVVGVTAGGQKETQNEPSLLTKGLGAAQTAIGVGKDIITSPLGEMAIGGYGAKKVLVDPILEALKARGGVPGPVAPEVPKIQVPQNVGGGPRPAISPAAQQTFNKIATPPVNTPPVSMAGAAEVGAGNQPGLVQRGMDMASKMRQIAAQRVIAPAAAAAAPAAVPAAVAAGGAGLTAYATNLLSKLTPEQRKQLMGDIGSDTGFAAAIMNGGQ